MNFNPLQEKLKNLVRDLYLFCTTLKKKYPVVKIILAYSGVCYQVSTDTHAF